MKKTILFALTISLCGTLAAQSFYASKRNRNILFSVGTGTSSYYGELSNPGDYLDARLNLNFGLQYFISSRVALRSEITWFQLSGDDAEADTGGRAIRNLSFVSNNYELNIEGIINLFPKGMRFYQRKPINPYFFFGLGLVNYNPRGEVPIVEYNGALLPEAGDMVALRPLETEGAKYGLFALVIPVGFGVKYKVGPFFNLAIEGGFRKAFTDYLDDISTVYADKTGASDLEAAMADKRWALPDTGPASIGGKRGNPDADDAYMILNVKVEYFLPAKFFSGKSKRRRSGGAKRRRRR